MNKEIRALFRALEAQGFKIDKTKKGWRITPPDPNAAQVTIHATQSDNRSMRNALALLRRSGFSD